MLTKLRYEVEQRCLRYRVRCSECKNMVESSSCRDFTWAGKNLLSFKCPHCGRFAYVKIRDVKEVPYVQGGYQPVNER